MILIFIGNQNLKRVNKKLVINTELKIEGNIDAYAVLTEWNDFINI